MPSPTKAEIRDRQETLNRFTSKYLKGVKPLRVDGELGQATRSRTMLAKYYVGYGKHRDTTWTKELVRRLRHPRSGKYFPRGMVTTGIRRRAKQKAQWAANHFHAVLTPGVTRYDGVPVAKCAVPILQWCREHGWGGRLVSGWRAPWYSTSLCLRMCGHPQCSGTCAGAASNHSGNSPQRFALDVSDYLKFREVVARCPLEPHIHNALNRDLVHFSPSGV